jgi:hypothetical protein
VTGGLGLRLAGTLLAGVAVTHAAGAGSGRNPVALLTPLVSVNGDERTKLDAGGAVVSVMHDAKGQIALFGAISTGAGGQRLLDWARRIDESRRGKYVEAVGRFSSPPHLNDLAALVLDEQDLEDVRECRPGDCGLKLDSEEMGLLRRTIEAGGRNWQPHVQAAFRAIVLNRVRVYESGSRAATYDDKDTPVLLDAEFQRLIDHSPFLRVHFPQVADYVQEYPAVPQPVGADSFLYWSKDVFGARPVISVTHVTTIESADPALPEALVVSRQVFATHYLTASLGLTAVTRSAHGSRYLVYVNRSRVDLLDGAFGGLIRSGIERRLRADAPGVLRQLRSRLEAGDPAVFGGVP